MNNQEKRHVSYSQLSTYLMCPLKYKFAYVDCLEPEFTPSALTFGGTIHEAIGCFYRTIQKTQTKPDLDEILQIFKNEWFLRLDIDKKVKFDEDETDQSLYQLGLKMLETFYKNAVVGQPICIEQEFRLQKMDKQNGELLPIPLFGRIDLIERDMNGRIVVVDFKTASKKYAPSKADEDLQLTIYTCALSRSSLVNGDKTFLARFDVITKTKKPELVSYPTMRIESDHNRMMKLAKKIIDAIEAGIFYPNTGWQCSSCQHSQSCKNW